MTTDQGTAAKAEEETEATQQQLVCTDCFTVIAREAWRLFIKRAADSDLRVTEYELEQPNRVRVTFAATATVTITDNTQRTLGYCLCCAQPL